MMGLRTIFLARIAAALVGCPAPPPTKKAVTTNATGAMARGSAKIQSVSLNDPIRPDAHDSPINLNAAKNEWASFAVQISGIPKDGKKLFYTLRVQAPRLTGSNSSISADDFSA